MSTTDRLNFQDYTSPETSAFIWPDDYDTLARNLGDFRKQKIQRAILKGRKGQPEEDLNSHVTAGLLGLKLVRMTPNLKKATQIDKVLEMVLKEPLTDEHKEISQALLEKWNAEEAERLAGLPPPDETEEDSEPDDVPITPMTPRERKVPAFKPSKDGGRVLSKPPRDHPIYGRNGIMFGLLVDKSGGRRTYVMDPSYSRKYSKVYGNNGFEVGDWFPLQRISNLRGIHSQPMAGIDPGPSGAYSIVVKSGGVYEALDEDHENVLYYSGSGSHDNLQSQPRETTGTRALRTSIETRQVVRVLRAGGNAGKYPKPDVGMRYDGLYRVEGSTLKKNTVGGIYEQFKLVRLTNQSPIDHSRPSPRERNDYGAIPYDY